MIARHTQGSNGVVPLNVLIQSTPQDFRSPGFFYLPLISFSSLTANAHKTFDFNYRSAVGGTAFTTKCVHIHEVCAFQLYELFVAQRELICSQNFVPACHKLHSWCIEACIRNTEKLIQLTHAIAFCRPLRWSAVHKLSKQIAVCAHFPCHPSCWLSLGEEKRRKSVHMFFIFPRSSLPSLTVVCFFVCLLKENRKWLDCSFRSTAELLMKLT